MKPLYAARFGSFLGPEPSLGEAQTLRAPPRCHVKWLSWLSLSVEGSSITHNPLIPLQ